MSYRLELRLKPHLEYSLKIAKRNKFVGSSGEIWFGKRVGPPKVTEVKVVKLTFLVFVTLGGLLSNR